MTTPRYKLGLGEAAYGPGDVGLITLLDEGNIAGPKAPGWHGEYMLTRCLTPTSYYGQEVRYLVLSPASSGVSLATIRRRGAAVVVDRVLPGIWEVKPAQFAAHEVQYWGQGVLRPLTE